ncbi:hypothetical protein BC359_05885 [Priestia flexa]|nr:hypothetical protein BC359_05885 [Priestia flexa]
MDDYYLCSRVFIFLLKRKNNKTENSVNIYATLVILTVYFGAVGIKKMGDALKVGLLADLVGIVASVVIVILVFGS